MIGNRLPITDYRLPTGFTLVELIIYLAIVAVLLTGVSSLAVDLLGGQVSSRADREVAYNVRFIADQLASDIASARQIDSLTNDRLALDLPGGSIVYEFPAGRHILTRQVGGGEVVVVNTSDVSAAGSFADHSFGDESYHVGVNLAVASANPGGVVGEGSTSTLEFAVELRGRK